VGVGEPLRLVVSTPPRHGKTETLLHFIAWYLTTRPERTCGYVTYAAALSRKKSIVARRLATVAEVALSREANRIEEWRTTQGGGLLATGIGGPLTGMGLDVLLVDDPTKNRAEAESALIRERNWDWFNDVAFTRIEPGGSAIVVQTRWHPDDLAGKLIKQGWECIRLPAISDAGEALWPDRWPVAALEKKRAQVGEYSWASIYQGTPRSKGGSVFNDVRFYDAIPSGYREAIGVDLAYSAKKHADYSVAIVLAEVGGIYYVKDVVRRQTQAPRFGEALSALAERHNHAHLVAYIGASERGVVDFLATTGVSIDARVAVADKHARAQPVAAAWNAGKILVPRSAPWLDDFVAELADFTGVSDVHDDQVDALAAAFDAMPGDAFGSEFETYQDQMPMRRAM